MASKVPEFLYGTAWKEDDTGRCVRDALEAGFRGIDTANQRVHYHEAAVGEALRQTYDGGVASREDLFLQTKFTPRAAQDHRLPYDADAPLAVQVEQSMASSLEHLRTDVLDSYVLHGPSHPVHLTDDDWEIWQAMEKLHAGGKTRQLGVSNVSLDQLRELCEKAEVKPRFVQNRCFARKEWDKPIREYCREQGIVYQGFSLLTANGRDLDDPRFLEIPRRLGKTPAQVVFRFALEVGMVALTGTTDPKHMRQDLECLGFELGSEDVERIETIAA